MTERARRTGERERPERSSRPDRGARRSTQASAWTAGDASGAARGRTPEWAEYRAPRDCPVCGDELAVTRLGCASCGSELAGVFASCEFCALNDKDTELLRVFLVSRGNLREVEKHLGVSYPTARLRFSELLAKLGLAEQPEESSPGLTRDQILSEVATGALTPVEGQALLAEL